MYKANVQIVNKEKNASRSSDPFHVQIDFTLLFQERRAAEPTNTTLREPFP